MAEVLDFPQQEDRIWRCDCSCCTNYLYENGRVECANCGAENPTGHWSLPPDLTPQEPDEGIKVVRDLPSAAYQSRRVAQEIQERDVAAIMVLHENGRIFTWAIKPENEKEIRWFRRKVRTFLKDIGADWKRCP